MRFAELLAAVQGPAQGQVHELMGKVKPADLTAAELVALVAILEPVAERLEAARAPVLNLV